MKLKEILARIERRLKVLDISADKASKQAGKPDAIRNLRRAVKEGSRSGISTATIEALAPALETTATWLIEGSGSEDATEDTANGTVRLVGYVGAGAETHFYAVAQGDLDEVPAPDGATEDTRAVEIRGDSLGSLFDRWLVFYDDVRRPVTNDLVGKLCVVGLADDRVLIKKIGKGKRGRYQLLSEKEEPIEDAEIEWAASVKIMVPK